MGHSDFDPHTIWLDKEDQAHIGIIHSIYYHSHLYRSQHGVDKLSNDYIGEPYGIMKYRYTVDNTTWDEGLLSLP